MGVACGRGQWWVWSRSHALPVLPQAKETESATVANLSPITKSVVAGSGSAGVPGVPIRGTEVAGLPPLDENHSPFNFRSPMDNIVIRTFQFPSR